MIGAIDDRPIICFGPRRQSSASILAASEAAPEDPAPEEAQEAEEAAEEPVSMPLEEQAPPQEPEPPHVDEDAAPAAPTDCKAGGGGACLITVEATAAPAGKVPAPAGKPGSGRAMSLAVRGAAVVMLVSAIVLGVLAAAGKLSGSSPATVPAVTFQLSTSGGPAAAR